MLQKWDSGKIGELFHLKFLLFAFPMSLLTVRCLWVPARPAVTCEHRDILFFVSCCVDVGQNTVLPNSQ